MALGSITFRARRDVEAAVDLDHGVRLRGELEWFASGSVEHIGALMAAAGSFAEGVSSTSLVLRFGNSVGRFVVGALGCVDVRCGKWDDDDLSRVALALPFAVDQQAGLPHDRSLADREPVLLHTFLHARHIVLTTCFEHSLVAALKSVIADPHRRFEVERVSQPLAQVQRVDGRTLHRLASGAEPLGRAPAHTLHLPLVQALRGHLPDVVDVPRARHTLDTVENRFVKSVVGQVTAIIDRVEALGRKRADRLFWRRILDDVTAMRAALAPILRHAMWSEVSPLTQVPMSSSVLHKKRGYREVLRHHLALRAATRLPLDADALDRLLGAKDVAALYELWCFFAVVRAVEVVLRRPPSLAERPRTDELQVDVPWGMKVSWGDDVVVTYNASFTPARKERWRSSSVWFRPDIVIERGAEVHVLDAKLRVRFDDDDRGRFKNDDIAKMHAYRDALPGVCSAVILYPGDEARHYPSLDVDDAAHGVGAVPLVPGQEPVELLLHLARLLESPVTAAARAQDG